MNNIQINERRNKIEDLMQQLLRKCRNSYYELNNVGVLSCREYLRVVNELIEELQKLVKDLSKEDLQKIFGGEFNPTGVDYYFKLEGNVNVPAYFILELAYESLAMLDPINSPYESDLYDHDRESVKELQEELIDKIKKLYDISKGLDFDKSFNPEEKMNPKMIENAVNSVEIRIENKVANGKNYLSIKGAHTHSTPVIDVNHDKSFSSTWEEEEPVYEKAYEDIKKQKERDAAAYLPRLRNIEKEIFKSGKMPMGYLTDIEFEEYIKDEYKDFDYNKLIDILREIQSDYNEYFGAENSPKDEIYFAYAMRDKIETIEKEFKSILKARKFAQIDYDFRMLVEKINEISYKYFKNHKMPIDTNDIDEKLSDPNIPKELKSALLELIKISSQGSFSLPKDKAIEKVKPYVDAIQVIEQKLNKPTKKQETEKRKERYQERYQRLVAKLKAKEKRENKKSSKKR